MRPWVASSLFVLLGGCLASPSGDPSGDLGPVACTYRPEPEETTTSFGAGTMYLKTPTGGASWNGRRVTFQLSDDPARLLDLSITVEWGETVGSERTLRTGILDPDARSAAGHWSFGPYNGPSPLVMTFTGDDAAALGDEIVVDVGTTTEGPSSVALVDHEVRVTFQETYRCESGAPPQGRMSR